MMEQETFQEARIRDNSFPLNVIAWKALDQAEDEIDDWQMIRLHKVLEN